MKEKPDCENKITKAGRFSYWITKKLERSNKIDRNSKKSYKKAIQQEKKESTRIQGRRQYVAGSQEYPLKQTFKETQLKKI